jgi:hypothetical protein
MKTGIKALLAGAALSVILPLSAGADAPGKHPAYLHALADLREARWMLDNRPGDAAVTKTEQMAVAEIDKTLMELKNASIDDGKDIHDHVGVQDIKDPHGRLDHSLELLHKTREDVAREEDDPAAKGLRDRAIGHIDAAIHDVEHTIREVADHK